MLCRLDIQGPSLVSGIPPCRLDIRGGLSLAWMCAARLDNRGGSSLAWMCAARLDNRAGCTARLANRGLMLWPSVTVLQPGYCGHEST